MQKVECNSSLAIAEYDIWAKCFGKESTAAIERQWRALFNLRIRLMVARYSADIRPDAVPI